jgi:hypothetical protein
MFTFVEILYCLSHDLQQILQTFSICGQESFIGVWIVFNIIFVILHDRAGYL